MSSCWLKFVIALAVAAGSSAWSDAASHSKVRILDFEDAAMETWAAFVPPESADAGCSAVRDETAAHAGSASAKLYSSDFARFGVRFKGITISVKPGERYRLSAWVRLDPTFDAAEGTPGVLARLTLFDRSGSDFSGGHRYISLKGEVADSPDELRWERAAGDAQDIDNAPDAADDEWLSLEAEAAIPDGVSTVAPFVFVWKGRGTLWVDDIRFERVEP
ncbi:MAG: hypothetical protein ACREIA_25345 [Opitutaceae bacterium]